MEKIVICCGTCGTTSGPEVETCRECGAGFSGDVPRLVLTVSTRGGVQIRTDFLGTWDPERRARIEGVEPQRKPLRLVKRGDGGT